MKKVFYVFIGIIGVLLIFTWVNSKFKEPATDLPENKAALSAILKEPKVKDATITDADVLYVQVEDDGTTRNGVMAPFNKFVVYSRYSAAT